VNRKKLLSLWGLEWNPFRPNLRSEALLVTPSIESFAWRVEQLVTDGGFALITDESSAGKSVALRIVSERLRTSCGVTASRRRKAARGVARCKRSRQEPLAARRTRQEMSLPYASGGSGSTVRRTRSIPTIAAYLCGEGVSQFSRSPLGSASSTGESESRELWRESVWRSMSEPVVPSELTKPAATACKAVGQRGEIYSGDARK
jgi:hypothetical protein